MPIPRVQLSQRSQRHAVVDGGGPPPAAFTYRYPVTYGFNYGTWFLYDWASQIGGDGAFVINTPLRPAAFADGMSNTLAAAEVKAQTQAGGLQDGHRLYPRACKSPISPTPATRRCPPAPRPCWP